MKNIFLVLLSLLFSLNGSAQNSDKALIDSFIQVGDAYYEQSSFGEALEAYSKAEIFFAKSDTSKMYINLLINKGLVFDYLDNYNASLQCFVKALELSELTAYTNGMALAYNNIGNLCFFNDNYTEALLYYQKSLQIERSRNNTTGIAESLVNVGIIKKNMNDLAGAQLAYDEALDIYTQHSDTFGLATVLPNIGSLFLAEKRATEALVAFEQALRYQNQIENKLMQVYSLNNISEAYLLLHQPQKAVRYALMASALAHQMEHINQEIVAIDLLHQAYKEAKMWDSALFFHEKYDVLKDSLFTLEKHRQFADLQTQYETEKKQQTIEYQKLELRERNQKYTLAIVALLLVSSLLVGAVFFFFQKRKAWKMMVAQNVEIAVKELNKKRLNTNTAPIDLPAKYEKSSLEIGTKQQLQSDIEHLLENKKIFTDKDLTSDKLAKILDSNRSYLSQIINEVYGLNFSKLINKYRVAEVRRMMVSGEYDNYSLQGLSELVGFNSRSTFIAAFKEFTGVTPSFFLKEHQKK